MKTTKPPNTKRPAEKQNSIIDLLRGRITFSNETFKQKLLLLVLVMIFLLAALYLLNGWLRIAGVITLPLSALLGKGRGP